MNTKKTLAVLLCAALALTLAACGAKTDSEPLPTATPEVTATPESTATPEPTAEPAEEVTIHDFDIYVDAFKDENDIEITSTDDGTDIADTDALYVYLYNNGVTRQAVQADLDEGCDSPYIDGYLTYLDDLDKPSETPSNTGFGPGAHVKLEGATKTTYPGTDVEALEKDGVYYHMYSDGTTDGSYYVIDNEGNLSVELPWMGELQELSGEDITDKVKEALDSGKWDDVIMEHHVGY